MKAAERYGFAEGFQMGFIAVAVRGSWKIFLQRERGMLVGEHRDWGGLRVALEQLR